MLDGSNLVGRKLGRYQIKRILGSGGMGAVYGAFDTQLAREVALKVLREYYSSLDSDLIKRFFVEAQIVAQLHHPNIVQVYDFGTTADGLTYSVSPLVRGGTLRELILNGPIGQESAKRILSEVGAALDFAHSRGVIHRDVKPGNILLDENNTALLTDFGIAKRESGSDATAPGGIVGTLRYIAPEAFRGGSVDYRADIYALGIIAYEMLSGGHPFANFDTEASLLIQIVNGGHRSLKSVCPDLPKFLTNAVDKAMSNRPEDRFHSAADFVLSAFPTIEFSKAKPRFIERVRRFLFEGWTLPEAMPGGAEVTPSRPSGGSKLLPPISSPDGRSVDATDRHPTGLSPRLADRYHTAHICTNPNWTLYSAKARDNGESAEIHIFTDDLAYEVRSLLIAAGEIGSLVDEVDDQSGGALNVVARPAGNEFLGRLRELAATSLASDESRKAEIKFAKESEPLPVPGLEQLSKPVALTAAGGEFTRMFNVQSAGAAVPVPPPKAPEAPKLPAPVAPPLAAGGEFTRMFNAQSVSAAQPEPPKAPEPPKLPAAEAPPLAVGGEFTRMFNAQSVSAAQPEPPKAPEPLKGPGPVALPLAASGDFQRTLDAPQVTSEAQLAPPVAAPGEFTRMFSAPSGLSPFTTEGDSSGSAPPLSRTTPVPDHPEPPPSRPASPETPPKSDSGQFTRMFTTAPSPLLASTTPAPMPGAIEGKNAGEFTQLFQIPVFGAGGAGTQSPALVRPDVALTIQHCGDPAFNGRKTNIASALFRIGRGAAADMVLVFDHAISQIHAEIAFRDGGFWLRDMGSQNGTFLNGKRLNRAEGELLMFGSRIVLGANTQLVFVSNEVDEMPDLTGEVIGTRFHLKQRLPGSAKSSVYLADDHHLDAEAVVKILSPRMAGYPGYREQFKREAAVAVKLQHAQICPVIDFGEAILGGQSGTSVFVAMRHLGGTSLKKRLEQQEVIDLERVATWMEKLASALDFIHRKSVTHGGIKPSAVIFDLEDTPYFTDFAFSTSAGDEHDRALIGTPAYLAPEQWETGLSTPASDRFALGVLAYLLVTGFLPFENQEDQSTRARNLGRAPVPAHEIAGRSGMTTVPETLSVVLAKMLAANPEGRFDTADSFAAAFRQALRPPGLPPPPPRRPLVFISHQRKTSGWLAIRIKEELERRGYQVFVDSQQVDTVGRFPAKIEQNIDRSAVFICLLARGTLASKWVDREIECAVDKRKPMIPVFQDTWASPRSIKQLAPHVQELLSYDAVEFRSFQRHQIEASLRWLNDSVEQLVIPFGEP